MYGLIGCFVSLYIINLCLCLQSVNVDNHPGYRFLPKKCGVSVFSDTRIIGGYGASLGQYPWMARLGYDVYGDGNLLYLCAATIITRWHVITAKHCLKESLRATISQVRLGENYPNKEKDCDGSVCAPPVQDIDIQFIYIFKTSVNVTSDESYGDIALLKLRQPIKFNDFVQPICLPKPHMVNNMDKYLETNKTVDIAGWGTIHPTTKTLPEQLMYITLPIVEKESCIKTFATKYIDESQVCIGFGKGKDSCIGDSGGPAMKPVSDGGPPRYFLYGLVSYGTKTCGLRSAVYTNVFHYMKWILDYIM